MTTSSPGSWERELKAAMAARFPLMAERVMAMHFFECRWMKHATRAAAQAGCTRCGGSGIMAHAGVVCACVDDLVWQVPKFLERRRHV